MNNAQNGGSTHRSTDAKKDNRQSFADIMASFKLPTSSTDATTSAIPEPISQTNNIPSIGPIGLPAKTRSGGADLNMGEASEMQDTPMPEASETGMPCRSVADLLATSST